MVEGPSIPELKCNHGTMLTQKGVVSTSDSKCAKAHEIMVKYIGWKGLRVKRVEITV